MARPTGGEQQAQVAAPAASGTPAVPPQPRSPHVNMSVPPGHGGGAVYPPTPQMAADHHIGAPWSSGLFDCDQDQTNAVVTAFFPCVTYGQMAEILDNGRTSEELVNLYTIYKKSTWKSNRKVIGNYL